MYDKFLIEEYQSMAEADRFNNAANRRQIKKCYIITKEQFENSTHTPMWPSSVREPGTAQSRKCMAGKWLKTRIFDLHGGHTTKNSQKWPKNDKKRKKLAIFLVHMAGIAGMAGTLSRLCTQMQKKI